MTFASSTISFARCVFKTMLFAIPIAGCAQSFMTDKALNYDKAVAEFTDKQMFLNAVRASKRWSMNYTAISGVTGNSSVTGKISGMIPFGQAATQLFRVDPSLTGVNGFQFDVTNLQSAEFMRGILNPINADTLKFYVDANWTRELLYTMFISEIKLNNDMDYVIHQAFRAKCESRYKGRSFGGLCKEIETDLQLYQRFDCGRSQDNGVFVARRFRSRNYLNTARDACGHIAFQSLLHKFRLLRISPATTQTVSQENIKYKREYTSFDTNGRAVGPPAKSTTKSERQVSTNVVLKINRAALRADRLRALSRLANVQKIGTIELRSPQGMIFFLGEAIAAQTINLQSYSPKILVGLRHNEWKRANLFNVVRGKNRGRSVLTVRDHEGDTYSLVRPEYGADAEDRSLQALALVKQVVGLHISREDLPVSANIPVIVAN